MKISLVQSSPKLNRSNLEDVLKVIGEHKDSDVVVFPETPLIVKSAKNDSLSIG